MSQLDRDEQALLVNYLLLGLVLAGYILKRRSDRDELIDERKRRLDAEQRVRDQSGQMDGALEEISKLKSRVDELAASE